MSSQSKAELGIHYSYGVSLTASHIYFKILYQNLSIYSMLRTKSFKNSTQFSSHCIPIQKRAQPDKKTAILISVKMQKNLSPQKNPRWWSEMLT